MFYGGSYFDGSQSVMAVGRSSDGGATWFRANLTATSGAVYTVAISPSDTDRVYCGGYFYNASNQYVGKVFRSTNGGDGWSDASTGLSSAYNYVYSIAFDPDSSNVAYAAGLSGLYKTTNGGGSWTRKYNGYVRGVVVKTNPPRTVYAASGYNGVYCSTNAGSTWSAMNDGLSVQEMQCLSWDPVHCYLFAGTQAGGVFRYFTGFSETVSVVYSFPVSGWYMVSLPVTPQNSQVGALFPSALGGMAFTWDPVSGSYVGVTTMDIKKGYWIAVPGAALHTVTGAILTSYTDHFSVQGWYMIGSVLGTVNFTDPNDNPAGSVLSPAFGWNSSAGSYESATTLNEKEGYWVAVFSACDLTVGGSGGESPAPLAKVEWEAFYQKYGKTPPSPPDLDGKTVKAAEIPKAYGLSQNYPNPFNPETTIRYQIVDAGFVRLVIYNTMGQVVKRLVDEQQNAGYYEVVWNGKDDRGLGMVSGMYLVKMEAGGFTSMRKAVLMR